MLPRLPYVVVDMNQLRSEEVIARLIAEFDRSGVGILLPSVASYELHKGSIGTLFASLRPLAARPEAVLVVDDTILFRVAEQRYRTQIHNVVNAKWTGQLREVIAGLDVGAEYDDDGVEAVRKAWSERLGRENNARIVRELEGVHRRVVPRERATEIRNALVASDRGPLREYLVEAIGGIEGIAEFLMGMGYGYKTARKLAAFPSFSALLFLALHALTLRWRVMSGIEGKKDEALVNDALDLEYVQLALYGQGFASIDRYALDAYADVQAIVAMLWPA